MRIVKPAVTATIVTAIVFGSSLTAANANKRDTRNFLLGAAAATVVVAATAKNDCKKWKVRYKRTGNPAYLDRYYACV